MTSHSHLQAFIDHLAPDLVPGLALAIGNSRGVIWKGAAGYVDLEQDMPAHPGCIFGVGSITKVFVAVVTLQLVEEGRIGLDRTLAQYLPVPMLKGIANAATATIRQLLSHYSGIASWEDDALWIRDGRGEHLTPGKRWARCEPLDYIRDVGAVCEAGEDFHYSNTNYTLLGLLIEAVTSQALEQVLAQRILNPLKMTSTGFEEAEGLTVSGISRRYHWATDSFLQTAGISPSYRHAGPGLLDVSASQLSVEWAAGGIVSSASDIVTFMAALKSGRLLGPTMQRQFFAWLPAQPGRQMGLGIFRACTPYGPVIGHGGNVLGFSATTWWFEDTDCVLALLTNVGSMHAGPDAWSASRIFESTTLGLEAKEFCRLSQACSG
ncbi:D-alanyl-D-alanine carboxypeptidase [Pseudomonas graminis]|uniref:serine hydrolase domain-containing protein n=1 Tax=Pseudomonas graminis TaxID=158627 RepID=UPI00105C2AA7|nr:serine hydrolase domain-containing protein [Pseudomonas graminis]TDV45063.1 D-alanyl-D-alanine carboxypeptidase [Pseudomonas graminis]